MEQVKEWIKASGLSNLGWLGGMAGAYLFGLPNIATGCLFVFAYINFNVIRKLIKGIKL